MNDPAKNEIPLVSVIMPCYNDEPSHIDEALRSALNQTHTQIEVILVDDGSTNSRTLDHLAKLQDPRLIVIHQDNAGPSGARNTGVRLSSGKYILPLDSDDRIAKTYAEVAVAALEHDSSVNIVYGNAEYFGAASGPMQLDPFSERRLLTRNLIFNSAVYRRSDFDAVGGYNERLVHGFEDHEMWLKICARGGNPVRLDETVLYYRIRSLSRNANIVADRRRFIESQAEIFRANHDVFARHPEVLFEEIENLKAQIKHWQHRYGPLERILESQPWLARAIATGRHSVRRLRDSLRGQLSRHAA